MAAIPTVWCELHLDICRGYLQGGPLRGSACGWGGRVGGPGTLRLRLGRKGSWARTTPLKIRRALVGEPNLYHVSSTGRNPCQFIRKGLLGQDHSSEESPEGFLGRESGRLCSKADAGGGRHQQPPRCGCCVPQLPGALAKKQLQMRGGA